MAGPEKTSATQDLRIPPVWGNVPQRNKNFTGREELLTALRDGIARQVTAVVPALMPCTVSGESARR